MANNISISTSTLIQIADQNTVGFPVMFSRNPVLSSILAQNWVTQTINVTASFNLPLSGTGSYLLIYVKNLSALTGTLLIVTLNSLTSFVLAPQAFWMISSGGGSGNLPTPISSITLTSSIYPILAEYAVASAGPI